MVNESSESGVINEAFIVLAETKGYKVEATLATWSGLVLIFVIATRKLSKYIRFGQGMIFSGALFLCLVGVLMRSETSISDSINKRTMADRYHHVASLVQTLNGSSVSVIMSLNGESVDDTAARLAKIYQSFYDEPHSDIYFGNRIQKPNDYIVSNDPQVYTLNSDELIIINVQTSEITVVKVK